MKRRDIFKGQFIELPTPVMEQVKDIATREDRSVKRTLERIILQHFGELDKPVPVQTQPARK